MAERLGKEKAWKVGAKSAESMISGGAKSTYADPVATTQKAATGGGKDVGKT